MSARHAAAGALALLALTAAPGRAQQAAADTAHHPWRERVSVAARVATFRPSAGSEAYALIDRALAPGAVALRPTLVGGAVHLRLTGAWGVLLGAESGASTVVSVSRMRPAAATGDVRQQTTLDLTAVQYVGAEWRALRWRGASAGAADRLRVLLGAGGGSARYRLHQWGDFVDEARALSYADDFRSTGRGAFGYASAGVEVPLRRWVALQGEVRRQAGSAPMSADFASFDRIDLGGTRLGAGLRLTPFAR